MPEVTENNPTISEAVTSAVEASNVETTPPAEPEVKEPEVKEAPKEAPPVEFDASPDEIKAALSLSRSLSDPGQRKALLEFLAEQGGYDLHTKRGQAALKRDTKAVLQEKLGSSYQLLEGDRLAEAFDELIKQRVAEETVELQAKVKLTADQANQQRANAEMESFFTRHKIADAKREEIATAMMQKAEKFKPADDVKIQDYLDDIYGLINIDNTRAREIKDRNSRIERTAKEFSNSGKGGIGERLAPTRNPTLNEAVAAAMRGEKFEG